MARVLTVDDEVQLRLLVTRALEREGFEVGEAETGQGAIDAIASGGADCVLLDVNLPDMSGFEVLAHVRRSSDVPVILVTGAHSESERVIGLDLGADDYVVKPFSVRELAARVRSVMRRTAPAAPPAQEPLQFDDLEIRVVEREVLLAGRVVEMTPKEFDLLAFMAASPRKVFTRDELLAGVWESSGEWQDPATVTEHVRRLRRKLEADPEQPRWLLTVRGVGYRFEP
jgi:two-component system, OmpR family, phosphate regulon response regulator PhoB